MILTDAALRSFLADKPDDMQVFLAKYTGDFLTPASIVRDGTIMDYTDTDYDILQDVVYLEGFDGEVLID